MLDLELSVEADWSSVVDLGPSLEVEESFLFESVSSLEEVGAVSTVGEGASVNASPAVVWVSAASVSLSVVDIATVYNQNATEVNQ